jgi:hypothetical protein
LRNLFYALTTGGLNNGSRIQMDVVSVVKT